MSLVKPTLESSIKNDVYLGTYSSSPAVCAQNWTTAIVKYVSTTTLVPGMSGYASAASTALLAGLTASFNISVAVDLEITFAPVDVFFRAIKSAYASNAAGVITITAANVFGNYAFDGVDGMTSTAEVAQKVADNIHDTVKKFTWTNPSGTSTVTWGTA